MLRAHQLRCAAMIGGYCPHRRGAGDGAQPAGRTTWWPPRPVVRSRAPRVIALEDSGFTQERDPAAHTRPAAVDGAAGRAVGARRRASRSCPGAAKGIRPRAGLRPLPHDRPLQALHRPDVAARPGCRGCGMPVVRPRRSRAAVRSMRVRRRPRGRRRRPPHRRGTRPGVSRHHGGHLRRRHRDRRRCPATPPLVVATPGAEPVGGGRLRCGAAARRAGRCSAVRICARPRTRCAAGWRRRRWFAAAPTAEWSPLVAESAVPTVQALIRWDPVGHAEAELDSRAEVGPAACRAHGGRRRRS